MMQTKNKLFGASFEQSKKIIDESILTEDGAKMGVFSSMSFWKRTTGLVTLLMIFAFYGAGIGFPDQLRQSTENVQMISQQSAALIGEIGFYLRPVIIVLIFTLIVLTMLNIVPKGNYANQLLYGIFYILVLQLAAFTALLPMAIGLLSMHLELRLFMYRLFWSYTLLKSILSMGQRNLKRIYLILERKEYLIGMFD